MIGSLNGPWLLVAALLLLGVAVRRAARPARDDFWWAFAIGAGAAAARILWGIWGPLHINGQGPLWVRGALDSSALESYGPGYFELFHWTTRVGIAPDRAVFAANASLSALNPSLLYATARLLGIGRGGALGAALVLAADPVIVRTAASEGYFSSIVALVLGVQASLALWVRADARRDQLATLTLVAAGLLAAAAARIHPMAYAPLALSPLVVLGAASLADWRSRLTLTAAAAAALGIVVLITSGSVVLNALAASPMTGQALGGASLGDYRPLLALAMVALLLHRWTNVPLLPLLALGSLAVMLATRASFLQHPLWQLCYQRLFWPGMLLGAAALLPRRWQGTGAGLAVAAAGIASAYVTALPSIGAPNTEQLEYRFLQEILAAAPPGCTVAAVARAGNRVWEIPSYLVPSGTAGAAEMRSIGSPSDLETASAGGCLLYVRSSLCSSAEARDLCAAAERSVTLERVASRVFPAAPSYTGLPYDRPDVEVVVFRATVAVEKARSAEAAGHQRAPASVGDGAPITPEFAQSLYDQLVGLHASDGCRLVKFDTARFRIHVGLQAPSGAQHDFELATARRGQGGRRAGGWALAVPDGLERDCGATLAALEQALSGTDAPRRRIQWDPLLVRNALIVATFALLVLLSLAILWREARTRRPSSYAVLALLLVTAIGLWLRLTVSPRTFLHEYYHVAETAAAYLSGENPPAYGDTGPSLFRFAAAALGRPGDVRVVFLTNAILSSLAVPAIGLLALALTARWDLAVAAAALLCVLPHHLRFSAAEDLFVMAVTFGLWSLAALALYLRTGRFADAFAAALALSLAMQSRPEMILLPAALASMVLLVEPRRWRVLFAWPTLLALAIAAALLIPRFLGLQEAIGGGGPSPRLPELDRYLRTLVLRRPEITPPIYWVLLGAGCLWGLGRKPGLVLWVASLYVGFTLFSLSVFDNPQFNLRSQLLPTSFLPLVAACAAALWMELWRRTRRLGMALGAVVLAGIGVHVVSSSRGFVTELRDQQLEYAFLERTVPRLPERGTLLTAVEVGVNRLNAFPQTLLSFSDKQYRMVDVRDATAGATEWPVPGEDVLFYQGMFCYFADDPADPPPQALNPSCQAVHARYVATPLEVRELDAQGYSHMDYAPGPFRIGFYRLEATR